MNDAWIWWMALGRPADHGSQTSNRHISNLCVVALFTAGHGNLPPIGAASAWCGIPRRRNFAPRSATRCRTIPAINQQQGEDTTPPIPSPDAFLLVFHRGRAALFVSLLFFPLVPLTLSFPLFTRPHHKQIYITSDPFLIIQRLNKGPHQLSFPFERTFIWPRNRQSLNILLLHSFSPGEYASRTHSPFLTLGQHKGLQPCCIAVSVLIMWCAPDDIADDCHSPFIFYAHCLQSVLAGTHTILLHTFSLSAVSFVLYKPPLPTMLASLPCPHSPEWKVNCIHTKPYSTAIHVQYCRLIDKLYYLFSSLYDTTRSKAKEFISIKEYSL